MSSETHVSGNSGDATDTALHVDGLGKCYHIYASPRHRLKQLASAITRRNYYREFWALRNIGFTVKRGQTVGIVGPNGSGKSTLLQLIAGILTPTEGVLQVNGRVAALLELGAGFNLEFTGRENVYMNAAILGFSKTEVDERFRAIQHFAEIGDFIDRPVKTYSSGMFVRLAFSVAVNVEPEILIVDEALAVGDIKFQARCFRKFEEFQSSGRTILFVSHSTEHIVRHCSHAILLYKGELLAQGEPRDISNRYMDLVFGMKADPEALAKRVKVAEEGAPMEQAESGDALEAFLGAASTGTFETRTGYNQLEYRWGDRTVQILDYLLKTSAGYHINHVESGDTVDLYVKVVFHKDVPQPIFGLTIKSIDGITLFSVNSKEWDGRHEFRAAAAEQTAFVHFQFQVLLNSGDYLLSLGVAEDKHTEILPLDRRYDSIAIHVKALGRSHGIVTLPAKIEVLDRGKFCGE